MHVPDWMRVPSDKTIGALLGALHSATLTGEKMAPYLHAGGILMEEHGFTAEEVCNVAAETGSATKTLALVADGIPAEYVLAMRNRDRLVQ